jgi:hypothetical protein
MKHFYRVLVAAFAAFFIAQADAQNTGAVSNHAVPIGKGPGVSGFGSAVPGTAGRPFVSAGPSADPVFGTSIQLPYTGWVWTSQGANVSRFDRVLVGTAMVNDGDNPNTTQDWLNTLIPATTTNSQLAALAPIGMIGVLGGSRSADYGAPNGGSIGVMGFSQNNFTGSGGWGFYGEAWAVPACTLCSTFGMELDIVNKTSVVTIDPYNMFAPGLTTALWLGSGGDRAPVNSASVAIGILDNAATFQTGIVVKSGALAPRGAVAAAGIFADLPNNAEIRWMAGTNTPAMEFLAGTSGVIMNQVTSSGAAHLTMLGVAAPTAASCGGFVPAANSTDYAGHGSFSPGTTCSLTFARAFGNPPHCQVTSGSVATAASVTTTTTTLSVTFAAANSVFHWHCDGA